MSSKEEEAVHALRLEVLTTGFPRYHRPFPLRLVLDSKTLREESLVLYPDASEESVGAAVYQCQDGSLCHGIWIQDLKCNQNGMTTRFMHLMSPYLVTVIHRRVTKLAKLIAIGHEWQNWQITGLISIKG